MTKYILLMIIVMLAACMVMATPRDTTWVTEHNPTHFTIYVKKVNFSPAGHTRKMEKLGRDLCWENGYSRAFLEFWEYSGDTVSAEVYCMP